MPFLNKGRAVAVTEEVTYAAAAPTFTDSQYVDYTTAEISTSIENLERNVIRNSMLKLESVLGQEASSGSINVEVSKADVTAGVNGHLLYKNGIGKFYAKATATTVSATAGTTTTVLQLTSVAGINEGQTVSVALGTGTEFAMVTDITGLVATIAPALSAIPPSTTAVAAVASYALSKPNDTVLSLAVRENLKPTTGSNIDYTYLGVMVTDVSLDYPVANIATAAFSIGGAGFTTNGSGTNPVTPCLIATPVVGKNAIFKAFGLSFNAQDVSLKVGTTVTDVNGISGDGISNKIGVMKEVTGSFRVEYTGTSNMDRFKAGTKGAFTMLLRDGGKTSPIIQGLILPSIKLTNVTRSNDGEILYDTMEFQGLSIDCDTNEKALSVFFV